MCWSGAAIARSCAPWPTIAGAALRRQLLRAGRPRREGRRAGREGRAAPRHPAAAVSRSPAQGDRSGAAAAARLGQARDASRDPARAGKGLRRGRRHAAPRDYSQAQRTIAALRQESKLDEARSSNSPRTANTRKRSRRLASLCSVPIEVVDRLMGGDRPDPILILCKSAGWGWPTVKAIIMARPSGKGRRARRSTPPIPISSGCRRRPRSA